MYALKLIKLLKKRSNRSACTVEVPSVLCLIGYLCWKTSNTHEKLL